MSVLHALWQADGAFPSGSFAFSYGIEGAVGLRPGMSADQLAQLVMTTIRHRWAGSDRIAVVHAFRANGEIAAIAAVDHEVEASSLFAAMRNGSRRNGAAFLTSHARLGNGLARALLKAVRTGECLGHIAVMQGAVWSAVGLDERLSQLTSGYTVASGLISAVVRLGVMGVLEGQVVLRDCLPLIEQLAADPVANDAEMESFVPFLDIASARHAQADLRLFAN